MSEVDAEPEYISFVEVPNHPKRKTKIYRVETKIGIWLGFISWHGAWRQYTFRPVPDTIFSVGCMQDIQDKITSLMAQRRDERALASG